MSGGHINRLHPFHIENDEIPCFQFDFNQAVQLLRRTEKQTTLQLENNRLIALLFKNAGFRFRPVPVGRHLIDVKLVTHHRPANLFAQKQHNRQRNADTGSRDQADRQRHNHNGYHHPKIKNRRRGLDKAQRLAVDHAETDHNQTGRQCRNRYPGNKVTEQQG